jgi:hypothetical protein
MGEYQPKHRPCDIGDFSRDGGTMTRFRPAYIAELRALRKNAIKHNPGREWFEIGADQELLSPWARSACNSLPAALDEIEKLRGALRDVYDELSETPTPGYRTTTAMEMIEEALK